MLFCTFLVRLPRTLGVGTPAGRHGIASIAQLAEHVPRKHKVTSSILVGGLGRWSRGMILPSGGRGRGFDSRTAPFRFRFFFFNGITLLQILILLFKLKLYSGNWNLERGHPLKLERYRED